MDNRVVENANEFGMVGQIATVSYRSASLEMTFSFNSDDDDGRFSLYLGGGDAENSWGFNGVVRNDGLSLRTGPPEVEIAAGTFDPAMDGTYRATLLYDEPLQLAQLVIVDFAGAIVASIEATHAMTTMGWFAVSIENVDASDKWLDGVYFVSDGRRSDTLDDGIEIAGRGFMDGDSGVFFESLANAEFVEISFFVEEVDLLRMHAYTQAEAGVFTLYPPGCYLMKLTDPTPGDAWLSFMDGLADAEITAIETITTALGTYDAYRVEYRRQGTGELITVAWYTDDVGIVRYGSGGGDVLDVVAYEIVAGSGVLPLGVGNWWATATVVGVADDGGELPSVLQVASYPNPFNPRTTIHYDLPESGSVRLQVYDLSGRLVTTLVDEVRALGFHEVTWTGRDASGRSVPSGVYLCRLEAGGKVVHGRMTLVR